MRATLILSLLMLSGTAQATTKVALRTPEFIIVATDSKPTYKRGNGPPTVCKIYQTGKTYFGISGLDHDNQRGFFVSNLVADSFSPNDAFPDKVTKIANTLPAAILNELRALKAEDPETYQHAIKDDNDDNNVTAILLAEVREGVPYSAAIGFRFVPSLAPSIRVHKLVCPGDCPNGVLAFYLGKQTAIKEFKKKNRGADFEPVALLRKFVDLEIQEFPESVGPPIVLFRLDQNGMDWISNESGCPADIQPGSR